MRTMLRAACGAVLLAGLAPGGMAAATASDDQTTVGVSLDASVLLGIGLSVGVPVGDRFNVRGVYHGFTYEKEFEDGVRTAPPTMANWN